MKKAILIIAVVVSFLFSPARYAEAECSEWGFEGMFWAFYGGGSIPASIGAIVTGIGNWVEFEKKDEPSRGWVISGYIFGGLATAIGVTGLIIGPLMCDDKDNITLSIAFSLPALLTGAFSLTTTILNHTYNNRQLSSLQLNPLVFKDRSGKSYYGMQAGFQF